MVRKTDLPQTYHIQYGTICIMKVVRQSAICVLVAAGESAVDSSHAVHTIWTMKAVSSLLGVSIVLSRGGHAQLFLRSAIVVPQVFKEC